MDKKHFIEFILISAIAAQLLDQRCPKSGAAITQIRSEPKFRGNYASPLKFLFDVMNTENMPMRMRFEAAKQLLPYFHARIGAKGKKDSEIDKALIVSGSGRFAPKLPPKLTLVQSDKPESAPL